MRQNELFRKKVERDFAELRIETENQKSKAGMIFFSKKKRKETRLRCSSQQTSPEPVDASSWHTVPQT